MRAGSEPLLNSSGLTGGPDPAPAKGRTQGDFDCLSLVRWRPFERILQHCDCRLRFTFGEQDFAELLGRRRELGVKVERGA